MSKPLSELLNPACIELNLEGKRKPDIIRELARVLARDGGINDTDALAEEILEREKLTSTGLGGGIAIPHCLTPQVEESRLALGLKKDGVRFDAIDRHPVTLFFLLVGPAGDHSGHLQNLSRIARYLHDEDFCLHLRNAVTPEEVLTALRKKEAL